jgi:hypothetical protein
MISASVCLSSQPDTAVQPAKEFCSYTTCWDTILNPMETVWEYLRQNKLTAFVWESYEAIVEACRRAWLFLTDHPQRIRSLGARQWASVNV